MNNFYAAFESNWPEDEAAGLYEFASEEFPDANDCRRYLEEQADWIFRGQPDIAELKRRFFAHIESESVVRS